MRLVKAEILWTRKCNLRCQYCGMYRNDMTAGIQKTWPLWRQGLRRLKALGCDFTAVYGAEPLEDFKYLPEYFNETRELKIFHTLITNCTGNDTKEKLTELVRNGLHSLTVSFDGDSGSIEDKSSRIKSGNALETLDWFRKTFAEKVRDTAVVFTLTKTNLFEILHWIDILKNKNVHVFFDLIHGDVGNPGTKCRNYSGIDQLLFRNNKEDHALLTEFATKMLEKKRQDKTARIHQSYTFLNMLKEYPLMYTQRTWNCADDDVFPSWLTIDNDGTARVCDDFHVEQKPQWKFWDLTPEIFDGEFTRVWRERTKKKCFGCFWNTHIDAHAIKAGNETFDDYLNNELSFDFEKGRKNNDARKSTAV